MPGIAVRAWGAGWPPPPCPDEVVEAEPQSMKRDWVQSLDMEVLMACVLQVAQWMAAQARSEEGLSQRLAANIIKDSFGAQFVYLNDRGNLSISKQVLQVFKALTIADVVWARKPMRWRARGPYDPPGKRQVRR